MTDAKPKVMVMGGCGFLGREIVTHLVTQKIAEHVLVVDKVPPQMAWLSKRHQEAFKQDVVKFKSANLINPASVQNCFEQDFDWVINAAGETKLGLNEALYQEGITKLSLNCAQAAANNKAKIYVEISDGRMGRDGKTPLREEDPVKPWCTVASCKAKVEQQLPAIQGLQWIVVRPALIYGPGEKQGIVSNLMMGAVYRRLQEKMKLLWDADLHVNTVHVTDCARAVVFLCQQKRTQEVFHVVDSACSTQGSLGQITGDIFGVKVSFYGATSNFAKLDPEGIVAEANEKHLPPWAALCAEGKVSNTPLTPYVDADILKDQPLYLDGSKLTKLGFQYSVPKPSKDILLASLQELVSQQMFPRNALPEGVLDKE